MMRSPENKACQQVELEDDDQKSASDEAATPTEPSVPTT